MIETTLLKSNVNGEENRAKWRSAPERWLGDWRRQSPVYRGVTIHEDRAMHFECGSQASDRELDTRVGGAMRLVTSMVCAMPATDQRITPRR